MRLHLSDRLDQNLLLDLWVPRLWTQHQLGQLGLRSQHYLWDRLALQHQRLQWGRSDLLHRLPLWVLLVQYHRSGQ